MTTNEKRTINILIIVLIVLGLISIHLIIHPDNAKHKFAIPEFDENVVDGYPEIDVDLNHFQAVSIDDGYTVSMCGKPSIDEDYRIYLYFTSPSDNVVWLRYIIYDNNGKELGESGVIKPGQYLKFSKLKRKLEEGETVIVKVISYEPETYYSHGSANIKINVNSQK